MEYTQRSAYKSPSLGIQVLAGKLKLTLKNFWKKSDFLSSRRHGVRSVGRQDGGSVDGGGGDGQAGAVAARGGGTGGEARAAVHHQQGVDLRCAQRVVRHAQGAQALRQQRLQARVLLCEFVPS